MTVHIHKYFYDNGGEIFNIFFFFLNIENTILINVILNNGMKLVKWNVYFVHPATDQWLVRRAIKHINLWIFKLDDICYKMLLQVHVNTANCVK